MPRAHHLFVEKTVSKKVLIGITALIGLAFVAGCGDKKEEKSGGGGEAGKSAPVADAAPVTVDKATAGTIKGKVTFGNKPEKMPGEIQMGSKAKDCGTEGKPKINEFYVVGENDAAANVIVFVKSGPATNVKTSVPTKEIVFDQTNCMYSPRVQAMRAGQAVRFKSSDDTEHNIHLVSKFNSGWNKTMGAKGSFVAGEGDSQKIGLPELPVNLGCDIHTWMNAFLGVFKHDYFMVTTKDGMYELKDLPPGDYEIDVWHEGAKGKAQRVTLGKSETKTADFVIKFQ
jgi:plastocyanin